MGICICNYPNCNDWSTNGTVTTDVPVTDGSGVLCYKGTADNYEATYCKRNETMCAYFGVDGGGELLDCYDPYKHNSTFNAEACYNGNNSAIIQTLSSLVLISALLALY